MNDAIRRATTFDLSKSPYGAPAYPYVWNYNKEHSSIRLEMGLTDSESDRKRVISMFMFQVNGPPTGVGVLVHVAVWLADPSKEPSGPDWSAIHSRNTNWHMAAINHFKGALLNVPGGAYAVSVPEELPSPPTD